ncbi:UNVERIFIED_CONTAM: ribokinase, partial [Bifidobacterium breve]
TVSFIGAVGNDAAGKYMLNELEKEKINLSNVQIKDTAQTGTATVLLDENGQNSILVYAGANGLIDSSQINKAEDTIANSDYIIAQFETPISAIISAFTIAKKHGVTTILNPAPATTIDNKLLKVTNIIVPNETESAAITGINVTDEESMQRTARYFREKGVKVTIITLGSRGVYYSSPTENRF